MSKELIPQPDAHIGNIIASLNNLSPDDVNRIVKHQASTGLRFGEAAVALGMANNEQVLWALSQQFSYSYLAPTGSEISSELVSATAPFSQVSEFFRDMRSTLLTEVFQADGEPTALAVCSLDAGDGKTFFAANIAVAFSQLGGRTLLIDANMRNPRVHEVFNLKHNISPGLSSALAGKGEIQVVNPHELLPNLFVLPVGVVPPNPLELIHSLAFDQLLKDVFQTFKFVIVDTPAAKQGSDAKAIAAKCGAAMLITRNNVTGVDDIASFGQSLGKNCRKFLGAVVNDGAHS
jgi:protein-tyrosine kinase